MNIKRLTMHVVEMPLKAPFYTHLETVTKREAIIIEVEDQDGTVGWGEASAFSTPWYTEETVATEWHIIKDVLFPLLKEHDISHPADASSLFWAVRGNQMAKAGVESALWDLYAKKLDQPLFGVLGGTRSSISVGAVASGKTTDDMLERIQAHVEAGYGRIKVKISQGSDIEMLTAIRKAYPHISLMADANSAYSLQNIDYLKTFDTYGLMMIEQPLEADDMWNHAKLQRQLKTPVCLDESIRSFHDAKCAVEMKACRVINVKFSRVGGISEAKRIHDYCLQQNIDLWAGGMIEFGISRAHNVALASLPGFTMPGDIVSTDYYWEEDFIEPGIFVQNGRIHLSQEPGIGFGVSRKRIEKQRKAVHSA
ncbi:o-succinylbenzoate synthase [Domibacillus sp. PGB-M46]|uniref:o-succinylbenzoate synthase n=1 Tax=Domibacillus sp. PGB-M46 TaxID=2910255 RepID=UPI001F596CF5|nr:o-succinylbenzoate synthase [Domibacillus sp. PGB-M46]MCI2254254.1 o-succinylbenzoate synthase [Domibacillus sp. PGB-M46]